MTSEITDAIARLAPGESDAIKHLFDVSYVELKRLAHSRLWAANLKQSYATESLLHESYLRLVNQKTLSLPDRKHFFAYASKVMRSIILDAVREANAERRGGGQADLTLKTEIAEVTPRGATAMFMTALVKTRKFRVLERARMAEGIAAEKALNQQGMTTGQSGRAQYVSANYMFEATVSEATTDANKTSFSLGVASAAAGKG